MRYFIYLSVYIVTISLLGSEPIMLKIKNNLNLNKQVIKTFRSGVEESLTAQGYSLISQEQQNEALDEQVKEKKSDCLDDECLIDTGRMMAAKMLFIVDISKIETEYIFKAKLVDLETTSTTRTITKIYKAKLNSTSELLDFAKTLTNESIIKNLVKVTISSKPVGALLYIDSKLIGKTPIDTKITKGKHNIKLSSKNYEDLIFDKDFEKNSIESFKLKMFSFKKFLKKYTISLTTNPKSVTTKILNGNCKTKVINDSLITITGYENLNCAIKFSKKNYLTKDVTFYIKENKDDLLTLEYLKAKYFKPYLLMNTNAGFKLLYLSWGAGIDLFTNIGNARIINLGVSFNQNITDNYYYVDIYSDIKWKIVNNLYFGLTASGIFGSNIKTFMSGGLVEYNYEISDFFIKSKVTSGVSLFLDGENSLFYIPYVIGGISIGYNGF